MNLKINENASEEEMKCLKIETSNEKFLQLKIPERA